MSALFDPGREGILDQTINWATSVVTAVLVGTYTFNAAHKFLSDATTAGATILGSVVLGTKTGVSGVAGCANFTFVTPTAGTGVAILIVQRSLPNGTSDPLAATAQRLIAFDNTATSGLPVTTTGTNNVLCTVDVGANLLFKI